MEKWNQNEAGSIPDKYSNPEIVGKAPEGAPLQNESEPFPRYELMLTQVKYDAEQYLKSINEYRFAVAVNIISLDTFDESDNLHERPAKINQPVIELQPKMQDGHVIQINIPINSHANFFSIQDKVLEAIKLWQPFKRIGPLEPKPEAVTDKDEIRSGPVGSSFK